MTRPRLSPPAAWTTSVDINGTSTPPATPWTARNAIRLPALHARLDSTEPTRNSASAAIHSRLLPSTRCAQPVMGMVTASANR